MLYNIESVYSLIKCMQINNNGTIKPISIKQQIENKEVTKSDLSESSRNIELPDIRLSQILLPDKKIYIPQGAKPANFNKQGLSVEIPETYVSSDKENKYMPTMEKRFEGHKFAQYEDTKTGEQIIRATKNVFDENGVLNSSDVTELRGENKGTRYIKDFEHNRETEIHFHFNEDTSTVTDSKTTLFKDSEGKVTKTQEYAMTPLLEGVYDITETDAAGNKTIIAKTTQKEDGTIVLDRHLVSFDGTTTDYHYETDASEHHKKMFCQIKDADGNNLSTIERTYDKESDTVSYSCVNGNKYKSEKTDDGCIITDFQTGKKTEIKRSDFDITPETMAMVSKNKTFKINMEGDVLGSMIDTLPPDTLLTIHNNVKEMIPVFKDRDSTFVAYFDYLRVKPNPNEFVLNHELGHSNDTIRVEDKTTTTIKDITQNRVYTDQTKFVKAFTEEKAAFNKEFPEYEEKFVSYFLAFVSPFKGRTEVVAEANAINGTQPAELDFIGMRTAMLQQYFPRSIAALTNMMQPIYMPEQQTNQQNNER